MNGVTVYVVCPKCSTLYRSSECSMLSRGILVSKTCSYVEFPNHPQRQGRAACGAIIMKKVKSGAAYKLVPVKTFLYNGVIEALKGFVQLNGFLQQCNEWKEHTQGESVLSDVIHSKVWKAFRFHNNRPFLAAPNNICFALFNPYEHTQYSIRAIYLTILNLPRNEHENTILVGLIPGPTEPKRIINLLVDELLQLWAGITVSSENKTLTLHAMLLCFISDIPATRKVCGFPGVKARLGCSKCMKEFPCEGFGERTDNLGYDRTTWVMQSMEQNLHSTELVKNAKTPTEITATAHSRCWMVFTLPIAIL